MEGGLGLKGVLSVLMGLGRPRAPFSPLGESVELLRGLGPLQDTRSTLLGVGSMEGSTAPGAGRSLSWKVVGFLG